MRLSVTYQKEGQVQPIRLISSLSKLAEKAILYALNSFTDAHLIIPNEQFGFRAKHSSCSRRTNRPPGIKERSQSWSHLLNHLISLIDLHLDGKNCQVRIGNAVPSRKQMSAGVRKVAILFHRKKEFRVYHLPVDKVPIP
ncbi:uncharacterized protein LOC143193627 [Rhynchophorus ferrugineus]|uniref:uncharacterized protein LOC143193627 n=1 Tax=Rhynchophorus ferrugineus TaxID=354439 RepID=UPI003FCD5D0A